MLIKMFLKILEIILLWIMDKILVRIFTYNNWSRHNTYVDEQNEVIKQRIHRLRKTKTLVNDLIDHGQLVKPEEEVSTFSYHGIAQLRSNKSFLDSVVIRPFESRLKSNSISPYWGFFTEYPFTFELKFPSPLWSPFYLDHWDSVCPTHVYGVVYPYIGTLLELFQKTGPWTF